MLLSQHTNTIFQNIHVCYKFDNVICNAPFPKTSIVALIHQMATSLLCYLEAFQDEARICHMVVSFHASMFPPIKCSSTGGIRQECTCTLMNEDVTTRKIMWQSYLSTMINLSTWPNFYDNKIFNGPEISRPHETTQFYNWFCNLNKVAYKITVTLGTQTPWMIIGDPKQQKYRSPKSILPFQNHANHMGSVE